MSWTRDAGADAGFDPLSTAGEAAAGVDITSLQPRSGVGPTTPTNIPFDRIDAGDMYVTEVMSIIMKNGGSYPRNTPMSLLFTNRDKGRMDKATWSKGPWIKWNNFIKQDDQFKLPALSAAATTLTMPYAKAKFLVKGKRLMTSDQQGEIIEIVASSSTVAEATATATSGNSVVTIKRGVDGSTAAAIPDGSIRFLSTANVPFGTSTGELVDTDTPSVMEFGYTDDNFFSIFKIDMVMGKMVKGIKLSGNENSPKFMKDMGLIDWNYSLNRALWFGRRKQIKTSVDFTRGSMGGIHGFFERYPDRIYQRDSADYSSGVGSDAPPGTDGTGLKRDFDLNDLRDILLFKGTEYNTLGGSDDLTIFCSKRLLLTLVDKLVKGKGSSDTTNSLEYFYQSSETNRQNLIYGSTIAGFRWWGTKFSLVEEPAFNVEGEAIERRMYCLDMKQFKLFWHKEYLPKFHTSVETRRQSIQSGRQDMLIGAPSLLARNFQRNLVIPIDSMTPPAYP